jgi:hypothetical protein
MEKDTFQTVILEDGVIDVNPTRNITIEDSTATELLANCFSNVEQRGNEVKLILNMNRVTFITEGAREILCTGLCSGKNVSHLAFVSNNQLSYLNSELTRNHCHTNPIE